MNHAGAEFWTISFWFSKMHIIILSVLYILMRSMPAATSGHLCLPLLHQPPFTLGPRGAVASAVGCPQGHQRAGALSLGLITFVSS